MPSREKKKPSAAQPRKGKKEKNHITKELFAAKKDPNVRSDDWQQVRSKSEDSTRRNGDSDQPGFV